MNLAVDCPKCDGKMVPLSTYIQSDLGIPNKYAVLPFAEWKCVKCNYVVRA